MLRRGDPEQTGAPEKTGLTEGLSSQKYVSKKRNLPLWCPINYPDMNEILVGHGWMRPDRIGSSWSPSSVSEEQGSPGASSFSMTFMAPTVGVLFLCGRTSAWLSLGHVRKRSTRVMARAGDSWLASKHTPGRGCFHSPSLAVSREASPARLPLHLHTSALLREGSSTDCEQSLLPPLSSAPTTPGLSLLSPDS